jgi:hypothetical protein
MNRALAIFAMLCVIGWSAMGIYLYWPFLAGDVSFSRVLSNLYDYFAESKALDGISKEEFLQQEYRSLVYSAGFQIMALAISVAGLVRSRWRALLVLASASLYLGVWLPGFLHPVSISQTFELKMLVADRLNRWGGFFLLDVTLPILFMAAWLGGLGSLLLQLGGLKRVAT